ncbi:lytic murein transglycosylase B [Massilia sp. W12]|uniref:lytic murein transglycosylase B n=1 Tax=Massilia sp. W12 TaxID=3126507 RepID=UPI0030D1CE46
MKLIRLTPIAILCAVMSCAQVEARKAAPAAAAKTQAPAAGYMQRPEMQEFIAAMVQKHGFDEAQLRHTMGQIRHSAQSVQLMKPGSGGARVKNWEAYRRQFVEPVRIQSGVRFWRQYQADLARAEREYGVPAEALLGILGVETVFGRQTGNFRVLDVTATLAFDYPDSPKKAERSAYFLGELEAALLLAREGGIDPFSLRGSYAGAIGWPQFMPSSIRRYAVDFDGDGVIDLRNSPVDAIGSIAHYLHAHGWQRQLPAVYAASLDPGGDPAHLLDRGLQADQELSTLQKAGIIPLEIVPEKQRYGLVDLPNGNNPTTYYIGTSNFFAITHYNRSYFYAMSVWELGQNIKNALEK